MNFKKSIWITTFSIAILVFNSSIIFAVEKGSSPDYAHTVDGYYRYFPSEKLDNHSGKVAILESQEAYSYDSKAGGKLPVTLAISNLYINIGHDSGNTECLF